MESLDLGYLLQRCAKRLRSELADSLKGLGLTPQQAAVLIAVYQAPTESLSHGGVASAIDADAATTTGLLGRLERDGWLSSAAHPTDGRSRLVALTEQGRAAMPDLLARAQAVSRAAGEVLSASELARLTELLQKLAAKPTCTDVEAGRA